MTSTCEKTFVIPAAPLDCPDWTTLLWSVAVLFGGASFSPDSATGDTFDFFIDTNAAQAVNTATIDYKGAGCNCNLHLIISLNTLAENPVCTITVAQLVPFSTILCVGGAGPLAAGTYDIPFSLPDTMGATQTFQIQAGITHGAPSYSIDVNGKFSNV